MFGRCTIQLHNYDRDDLPGAAPSHRLAKPARGTMKRAMLSPHHIRCSNLVLSLDLDGRAR